MAKNYLDTSSYFRIVDNPDINNFLEECDYLREPSDSEIEEIIKEFSLIDYKDIELPNNIISIDSDSYEAAIRKELPYTCVGYVKVASSLLQKGQYIDVSANHFVDPFKMAKITRDREEIMAVLPCSNVSYKKQFSARDSFRLALEDFFDSIKVRSGGNEYTLKETLFWLCSLREKCDNEKIILHKCPICGKEDIPLLNIKERQLCPYCGAYVYISDCLRIYEAIEESGGSNQAALGRLKVALKHIYLAHIIHTIKESNKDNYLSLFENMVLIVNGTLSIAGQPAWIHASMMKIIYDINQALRDKGKRPLCIIGLVGGGNIYNFMDMVKNKLKNSTIMCVTDNFRDKYINFNRVASSTTFGAETYYGQDFIYKSKKGRAFVFNLPYPFANKNNKEVFKNEKSKLEYYKDILPIAIKLIDEFDCDLVEGKIVPAVLSEKYTAISIEPGATVLDLLTKMNI